MGKKRRKKKGATSGVPEEAIEAVENNEEIAEEDVSPTGNTSRNSVLEQIYANAEKQRDQELGTEDEEEPDGASTDEDEEAEQAEEPEQKPETSEKEDGQDGEIDEPEEQEEETEELVTIKVDGKEEKVPKSKALDAGIRALQKESAADKRLEEATRLLNEAKAMEARKPAPSQDAQKEKETDEFLDAVKAIQFGDETEGAEKLRQLIGASGKLSEDEVISKAIKVMENRNAVEKLREEFKDIATNPVYEPYVSREISSRYLQMEQNGENPDLLTIGREVGNEVLQIIGRQAKKTVEVSNDLKDELEQKRQKKRTLPKIKSASQRSAGPEEEKKLTGSDIVKEMRKARGQL